MSSVLIRPSPRRTTWSVNAAVSARMALGQRRVALRESAASFSGLEVVEPEPLQVELGDRVGRARVGQHALDLRRQHRVVLQRARGRRARTAPRRASCSTGSTTAATRARTTSAAPASPDGAPRADVGVIEEERRLQHRLDHQLEGGLRRVPAAFSVVKSETYWSRSSVASGRRYALRPNVSTNGVAQVLLVAVARSQPAIVFMRAAASAAALAANSECCCTTRSVIGAIALLVKGPMCSSAEMTLAGLPVAPTRSRSVLLSCDAVRRRSGVRPARSAPCCCAHNIAVVEMSGTVAPPLPAPPVMTDVPPVPGLPALPGLPLAAPIEP